MQSIVPWKLQSPIYPTIAIMMSSTIQSMVLGGDPVTANRETVALKAKAYSLMSNYVQKTSGVPGAWADELMGCVLNSVMFEARSPPSYAETESANVFLSSSGSGAATKP